MRGEGKLKLQRVVYPDVRLEIFTNRQTINYIIKVMARSLTSPIKINLFFLGCVVICENRHMAIPLKKKIYSMKRLIYSTRIYLKNKEQQALPICDCTMVSAGVGDMFCGSRSFFFSRERVLSLLLLISFPFACRNKEPFPVYRLFKVPNQMVEILLMK